MREKARLEGKPMRYDGRWRDRDPAEAPAGVKPVIRLRAAQEGETVIDDKVQGKVVFANKDLDDLVLLRSDGNPTYMLAVVVDDHDMGVTHIIRGDDHLTNAARQTQIYQALGWEVPIMAHIPLIMGPTGPSSPSGTARSASTPIARWAICRPLCATIWRGSAGATATRNSYTEELIAASILARSAARRHASTSPSSRTSTAITCARRATTRCSTR